MDNFNLVYNRWNNETNKPIPNGGLEIGLPEHCWDAYGLLHHFNFNGTDWRRDMFQCDFYNLDDVSKAKDKKFFYIIDHGRVDLKTSFNAIRLTNPNGRLDPSKKYQTSLLCEDVINCFKNNPNLNIMFITEHEPDDEVGFEMLINFLRDNEIENDRIFVLNNNSNLNNLKNKYNTCVNVKTLDFIPFSSTLAFDVIQSEFVSEKKGKLFICHNKSPKPHRYMILALMKSMGVLENTNWSLIPPTKSHFTMGNFYEYFNHSDLVPIENDLMNLVNLDIKVGDFEKNRNWFNEPHREFEMKLPNNVLIPEDRETLENSYFNIVTESEYINLNKNIIHITEKSIRPFYFYQIPLIVATPLHIKTMKEKFDLDFFDDIIDHSYDNETDDKKRIFTLAEELKRINDNKDFFIEFYKKNQERLQNNKNKILKILADRKDYYYFKNLI